MMRMRRAAAAVMTGLATLLIGWFFVNAVLGQERLIAQPDFAQPGFPGQPNPEPTPKNGPNAANLSGIRIIPDTKISQAVQVGIDCIKDKDWDQAVKALQAILELKEDYHIQIPERNQAGQTVYRRSKSKFEANAQLGAMPKEGLETYEAMHGAKAKAMLDEAKLKGDREALADIAFRYRYTKSGIEANELLGTLLLARGQVFTAALVFERLMGINEEFGKLDDMTLFKAAFAFHRAGDTKNYDKAWKKLEVAVRESGGLKAGEEVIPLVKLQEVINQDNKTATEFVNSYDWLTVRGNNTYTAQAVGSPPLLDSMVWKRPILMDTGDDGEPEKETNAKARIEQAIQTMAAAKMPILPGFFPIATNGKLIYRTHNGVRAVFLKDGKDAAGPYKPGEIAWKTLEFARGLSPTLEKANLKQKLDEWMNQYQNVPGFIGMLYENTMLGTLSTDHRRVYAIDDLAVPPPAQYMNPNFWNQGQIPADLKPFIMSNILMAFDAENGKLLWDTQEDPQFADSHFLGVPISVGGRLYVLNEKNPGTTTPMGDAELRLVCIDPNKKAVGPKNLIYVESIQQLGMVQQNFRVTHQAARRTNAAHLAYGEGVLVCPTNAGEVFGIDLMSRSLVWSYPYREKTPDEGFTQPNPFQPQPFPPRPQPNLGSSTTMNWKSSPPAIVDGKVVFTAPDASSVHCISLRDGKPLWRRAQIDGDLYLAGVFNGRALIVGKNIVRALDLKDGRQLWYITTGDLPSGQGVASKGIYYLPLARGEIMAIDVEKGTVKAHNRSTIAGVTPGNLVFCDGSVLSQTPTELVAYPQLAVRLDLAKSALKDDPENLAKITEFGDLLLKDGQVHQAVETLLKVTAKNPPDPLGKRARDRLFEALTDLHNVDFKFASEKYLADYRALCNLPDNQEQQARLAKYHRIVGQGREAEGNLVEAFFNYKEFGALPIHRVNGGIILPEDPNHKIPTDVWLRARVSTMMEKATAQQRDPLEKKIAEEWSLVEAKKDPDAIRSFIGMFDVPFRVGREARLRLAEAIMEKGDKSGFLEAELNLQLMRGRGYRNDPESGGRALATLAKLEEKKGTVESMQLAAAYYRQLGRDFATAKVLGNQTGADLLAELANNKTMLPFLEETGVLFGNAKIGSRELPPGAIAAGLPGFVMRPEGDLTPFANQHRLLLDPSNPNSPAVKLVDVASGKERWSLNLNAGAVNNQINNQMFFYLYQQANVNNAYHPNARFRFFNVKGHLLVFQVGTTTYCVDGDTGRKLWETAMVDVVLNQPNTVFQQVTADAEGNPEFLLWNQLNNQRFRVTLGQIGAVQPNYVALLTQKGLIVNDPLRGSLIWKKIDVAAGSRVFGDENYLFLVEGSDSGGFGAGRVLRAIDGAPMDMIPDFSNVYQNRIRIEGRRILAANSGQGGLTLRLYDIVAGKDLWSKDFPAGSVVAKTEDPNLTGVIDPTGKLTAIEVDTGRELIVASVTQGRIPADEMKTVREPLLLADADRFYIALNKPVDGQTVQGGLLHNNFSNGLRCGIVNGWVVALQRQDGERKAGDKAVAWKKGDLAWHSYTPILNQMLVLDQFEQLPVMLFSARYNKLINGGAAGNQWVSMTQSLNKRTGKLIHDPGPRPSNSVPYYYTFLVDSKGGSISMVGYGGSVQHYVDDGRPQPAVPPGAGMLPGGPPGGGPMIGGGGFPPPIMLPPVGGQVPPNGRLPIIRRAIDEVPPPPLPLPEKR
jgi:outer membrane protein assembly factor BamB/tetratricopeptide (TPR) repeat protein